MAGLILQDLIAKNKTGLFKNTIDTQALSLLDWLSLGFNKETSSLFG